MRSTNKILSRMRGMQKLAAFVLMTLLLGSCSEPLMIPDQIIEVPEFYVNAKVDGADYSIYSGRNNYMANAGALQENSITYVPIYYSTIGNADQADSITFLISNESKTYDSVSSIDLQRTLSSGKLQYGYPLMSTATVAIALMRGGKIYTTYGGEQTNSHFDIVGVSDYTPKGSGHSMKKVDVSFSCNLFNATDFSDIKKVSDGSASLLFDCP